MRRADRLFQIINLLRGGRLTTARALAEHLEVAERTIYRDIAHLQACGVPIDGAAGLGYVLRAGYHAPPLMFDREEITAIVAGVRLVKAFGGPAMARAADSALGKVEAALPETLQSALNAVEIHALAPRISPETRDRLDAIDAAIPARRRLHIVYHDAEARRSERALRPLGLWFWGATWTLTAWCELREDFRHFRVDRIDALEMGDAFRDERGKTLADFYRTLDLCAPPPPLN